jgi:hypothetical protein
MPTDEMNLVDPLPFSFAKSEVAKTIIYYVQNWGSVELFAIEFGP